MTKELARAAINILGSDGSLIDITSMGNEDVSSEKESTGVYVIKGTHGMVPVPEGWGYVINNVDSTKTVEIEFSDELLIVRVTAEGVPVDLEHSITLHVSVDASPPYSGTEQPETPTDHEGIATAKQTELRKEADYIITPLQDAVDIDEATTEEESLLKEWKRYRVALSKVQNQEGWPTNVVWPTKPVGE